MRVRAQCIVLIGADPSSNTAGGIRIATRATVESAEEHAAIVRNLEHWIPVAAVGRSDRVEQTLMLRRVLVQHAPVAGNSSRWFHRSCEGDDGPSWDEVYRFRLCLFEELACLGEVDERLV